MFHHITSVQNCPNNSTRDKKRLRESFNLSQVVHESEHVEVRTPPQPAHRFEVTLEEDVFTQEKLELFQNYQEHVHGDIPSFQSFLCNSPLVRDSVYDHVTGRLKQLGSYHQCYRLDGRLIAIGVLDLLPHCVSGVYAIYHSDYEKWNFGKLTALREASMALEEGYGYYYMGYYIHSCQKMRYKGDYQPQYFLDLDTLGWERLDDQATKLMEGGKYVSMSRVRVLNGIQHDAGPTASTNDVGGMDTPMTDLAEENGDVETDSSSQLPQSAIEVEASGRSILECGMPGVLTPDEVEQQVDLDDVNIKIPSGASTTITKTWNLVSWDDGSTTDSSTLKGIIAELAGCVGPEVMRPDRSIVNFSRE